MYTKTLIITLLAAIHVGVNANSKVFPPVDFGAKLPSPSACPTGPPKGPRTPPPPSPPLAGVSAGDFVVDYNMNRVKVLGPNAFSLTLSTNATAMPNDNPEGTRITTKDAYESGKITARISSGASAPGLVSSFYLSNFEPERDDERVQYEVDFELMGARGHRYVQSNIFVAGVGGEEDFHVIPDHPTTSHEYGFEWDVKAGFYKWFLNGKLIRELKATGWPAQRIYWSFWGTKPCAQLNKPSLLYWAGLPRQSDLGKNYTMTVTDIKFTPGKAVPVKPVREASKRPKRSLDQQLTTLKSRLQKSCASLNPQLPAKEESCAAKNSGAIKTGSGSVF